MEGSFKEWRPWKKNDANEVVYNQPAEVDNSQEEESSDVQPEDQNTDQEKQTSEARNLPTASETESEQYQTNKVGANIIFFSGSPQPQKPLQWSQSQISQSGALHCQVS